MFRRLWQAMMVGFAKSPLMKRVMQSSRSATNLAKKYVGGNDASEALTTAVHLSTENINTSLFYLGEYVNTQKLVSENYAAKQEIVSLLANEKLDIHVSVDPTQLGSNLSWHNGVTNISALTELASKKAGEYPGVHCVMLDMEDYSVNSATIELHDKLKAKGLCVALTLQAYLRNTASVMHDKIIEGAKVRLVKGAFPATSDIAYTTTREIKANYQKLIDIMFSEEAKKAGFYPIIATHDHTLHEYAISIARKNNWQQGSYEFEMLYGARNDVAYELAARKEKIRLYLPFGKDWWPYATRRIGENPSGVFLLLRSLLNK